MSNEEPLHIIELRASNVLRLRAVRIRPNRNMVVISGRNAQGKSSVLTAIQMALGGKRMIPEQPVRHGARKAETVLDLGEIRVEQTITQKGVQLVVKGKDGIAKASPQTLLDKLTAAISFDPFAFSRMDPPKQDKMLKSLVGLDFTTIDAERAGIYAKRTEVNKELERLDALIEAAPHHPDAAKKLVDVTALADQLAKVSESKTARATAQGKADSLAKDVKNIDEQIAAKEAELAEYIARAQSSIEAMRQKRIDLESSAVRAAAEVPAEMVGADELQEKIRTAEATNAKVRANAEREKFEKQAQEKAEESATLTAEIEKLDADKADQLAAAKFPIDGLGFDDSGPTFNGVPLAQASQAERLRVSVSICTALNPGIGVMLVREGAFLDDESFKILAELAKEKNVQIWCEVIKSDDPSAVVIEDGSVLDSGEAEESSTNGVAAEA